MSEPTPRVKPSARERHRYLLFEVRPHDAAPPRAQIIHELQQRAPAELRVWLTRYDRGLGILRVTRGSERKARAFIDGLRLGDGCELRARSTSGTIAALQRRHADARGLGNQGR